MVLYFQVRDYIHVVDLSDGHIAALRKLFDGSEIGMVNHIPSSLLLKWCPCVCKDLQFFFFFLGKFENLILHVLVIRPF